MPLPITRYELDPTGTNRDNLIEGELHTLSTRDLRAVAPEHGAYFTESLVVYDNVNNTPLVRNVDYVCTELAQEASLKYGKEICFLILIVNKNITSTIRINYQCLGGPYTNAVDEMITLYESAISDNRPVDWSNVLNKPYGYPPALHSHILADVVGFEALIDSLDRISRSIVLSNIPAFEYLLNLIENSFEKLDAKTRDLIADIIRPLLDHLTDYNNPHRVNKEQVGLGLVENLPLATDEDIERQNEVEKYVTLRQIIKLIRDMLISVSITTNKQIMFRDDEMICNITTRGVSEGTELFWKIRHNGTEDRCFEKLSGSFYVESDSGVFKIYSKGVKLDILTGKFDIVISKNPDYNDGVLAIKRNLLLDTSKFINEGADDLFLHRFNEDKIDAERLFISLATHDYQESLRLIVSSHRRLLPNPFYLPADNSLRPKAMAGIVSAEEIYLESGMHKYINIPRSIR